MSSSTYTNQVATERGVSQLSNALARLTIPSKDLQALWKPQIKLFQPLYPNAAEILRKVHIPSTLTDKRIKVYIRSTTITPTGKAYTPQTSEILPGKLWIADRFSGTDSSSLLRLAITHVMCIGHEGYHKVCPRLAGVAHKSVIVPLDLDNTSLFETIDRIVAPIDDIFRVDPSNRVLVHCAMGVDWSPSVAVAMLMTGTGCSFPQAVNTVQAKRESSCLHGTVGNAVQQWWTLEKLRQELPKGRGYRKFRWAVEESEDTE